VRRALRPDLELTVFAILFNRDRRRVDLADETGHLHAKNVGRGGHVAFVRSKSGPSTVGIEASESASLGERYWIVGRIRLDAREALKARLAVRLGGADVSDALLCLHAYAAWGERFVDFLAGDFSFALLDDEEGRLVCVRDQLGVRSLFHASVGETQLVSDSLDWIASRPGIGDALDEHWIADFLATGFCVDFERTVYRDIHRLAPAHVLAISGASVTTRRYWRLEIAEPVYCRDSRSYSERFRELLSRAVADRLPPGKVGISMSGGLDSTGLAAAAVDATGDPSRVVGQCTHFESLMPDDEPHFSSLAARKLGIDLKLLAIDSTIYDPLWRTRSIALPEPSPTILNAHYDHGISRGMGARASVWFYGEGPDNALTLERDAYFSWLAGRREWKRLASALFQYARVKGVGGWSKTLRRHTQRQIPGLPSSDVPAWIDRGLAERTGLAERLRIAEGSKEPRHPWHPRAMASFNSAIWQRVLGDLELEEAGADFEWRHPYLDLRVLEFMLSVPPVPWGWEKHLLREAMRGRLPTEILERKKTPLVGSPMALAIGTQGLPDLARAGQLAEYVDVSALTAADPSQVVYAHALDHWLATHGGR
jgi:asparagine synthase (glutamine-hydrolysing)